MTGVSVLTIQKGRWSHLLNQIDGLHRSATPPGEFIIVSMDAHILEVPEARFPIRIIHRPSESLPLAQARNDAAKSAISDKLLFLDIDCIPSSSLIGMVSSVLDEFDGLFCAEVCYLAAGDVTLDWTEHELLSTAVPHPLRQFPSVGIRREPNPGLFWSLAFAIRRHTFFSLNGFNETFTGYGAEDTDFAFRAVRAGLDLMFLGGAGAFHQHHIIYDPPLQHFDDIVRNAQIFYDAHQIWPMQGWLDSFAAMDLITIQSNHIRVLRKPFAAEVAASRKNDLARF